MSVINTIKRALAALQTRLSRLTRRSTYSVKITLSLPPFMKVEFGMAAPESANHNDAPRRVSRRSKRA